MPKNHFYKYTPASTAIAVLRSRRLRWSSPLLFNDPFDVTQTLRLDLDARTLTTHVVAEMLSALESPDPPPQSWDPPLRFLHNLLWQGRDDSARESLLALFRREQFDPSPGAIDSLNTLQNAWADTVRRFRVLCLSELPDVTPMWNHYADAYRGVVLALRAEASVDSALQLARPIVYEDNPPRIASPKAWAEAVVTGMQLYDLFSQTLYTKTKAWSYEREWRVVSMAERGATTLFADMGFHPRELVGVYFGPSIEDKDADAISTLLVGDLAHVELKRARLGGASDTSFAFELIK